MTRVPKVNLVGCLRVTPVLASLSWKYLAPSDSVMQWTLRASLGKITFKMVQIWRKYNHTLWARVQISPPPPPQEEKLPRDWAKFDSIRQRIHLQYIVTFIPSGLNMVEYFSVKYLGNIQYVQTENVRKAGREKICLFVSLMPCLLVYSNYTRYKKILMNTSSGKIS